MRTPKICWAIKALGLWIAANEGAKFWLSVMNNLRNRGVEDILIAVVDGLKGFPDAINAAFPFLIKDFLTNDSLAGYHVNGPKCFKKPGALGAFDVGEMQNPKIGSSQHR